MKTKNFITLILGLSILSLWSFSFAKESCTTYFDGCNTCKVINGNVACTKMFCKATEKPYCIDDKINVSDSIVEKEEPSVDEIKIAPPYYRGNKEYIFDEEAIKSLVTQPSLIKVKCDTNLILKSLWFNGKSNLFSVGTQEWLYDYNFDLRNCSMRGNKKNNKWTNNSLTEKEALTKAKEFMKQSFFKNKVFGNYGDPIVIAKNRDGWVIAYNESSKEDVAYTDIIIDETDVDTLEIEYRSFSILFPYVINKKPVYNSHWGRAGIRVEVTADGITSINTQLLPFVWAVRKSETLSADEIIDFIKQGGNNSFRGNQKEIKLQSPERVNVLFNIWRNGINELYLSSGIKMGSNVRIDQRNTQPYEMIISDYKLGNSNYRYQ